MFSNFANLLYIDFRFRTKMFLSLLYLKAITFIYQPTDWWYAQNSPSNP